MTQPDPHDHELNNPVKTSQQLSQRLAFWQCALVIARDRGSDAEAIQCQQVVQDTQQAILALRSTYQIK